MPLTLGSKIAIGVIILVAIIAAILLVVWLMRKYGTTDETDKEAGSTAGYRRRR